MYIPCKKSWTRTDIDTSDNMQRNKSITPQHPSGVTINQPFQSIFQVTPKYHRFENKSNLTQLQLTTRLQHQNSPSSTSRDHSHNHMNFFKFKHLFSRNLLPWPWPKSIFPRISPRNRTGCLLWYQLKFWYMCRTQMSYNMSFDIWSDINKHGKA